MQGKGLTARFTAPPNIVRYSLALLVSFAGGALFAWAGTVLPWMLGSLVAMAAASVAGLPVTRPRGGLPLGQIIVGTTLGLYFTAPVLEQVLRYAPYILVGAVFALMLGATCAYVLARFSGCDYKTAFFASLPGGAAEMTLLAERFGARFDSVAAAQALRIVLVVMTIPPLITWSGAHGSDIWLSGATEVHYAGLVELAVIALCAGALLRHFKTPNGWVIGPLLVTIALTASGVDLSAMPRLWVNFAQVMIGCALGSRFNAAFFRAAPRFLGWAAVTVYLGIAIAAGFAWLVSRISGISFPTAILATAPGGVAEMSITARVLQLGVPIVTAFHVTRMAFLVLGAAPAFALGRRYVVRRTALSTP